MKTYIVKTSSPTNKMLLHSLNLDKFETTSFQEAENVFNNEEKKLAEVYTEQPDLGYSPTDAELGHAISCYIIEVPEGCEELDGNIIKESDNFFA